MQIFKKNIIVLDTVWDASLHLKAHITRLYMEIGEGEVADKKTTDLHALDRLLTYRQIREFPKKNHLC